MTKIHSIHQMRREGAGVSEIARTLNISRDTVYEYLKKDDFSPKIPLKQTRPSKLDPYKPIIDSWLAEDESNWKKQRHSGHRIWQRLVDELGADVCQSTVRSYVSKQRAARKEDRHQFLDLVWNPGEAQADFGEADFYINGFRRRLSFFVLTFPFSNVGLAQVFPGENAECVCQALVNIFEYIRGVPTRIVFDNAAGVGRRTCEHVRTTELFRCCAAHYGFDYSFCNPNSGHEKGNVENKVGMIRRNLFVPVPQLSTAVRFNATLLDRCMELSDKDHWLKGEPERHLFVEDSFALSGLPSTRFAAIRYERLKSDKQGKIRVDGCHLYSSAPEFACRDLIVGLTAEGVRLYTEDATAICEHRRVYGSAPSDSSDPASQLSLLCTRPGAWRNSQVRTALSEDLRLYLDDLGKDELKRDLRLMRNESARCGWSAMLRSLEDSFSLTGRIDEASVCVGAMRAASGIDKIAYDEPVDLGVYDSACRMGQVV